MDSAIQIVSKTIFIVEFITGNVGNGFIALVNIVDWIKRRKVSLGDLILTALAISRTQVLWLLFIAFSVYPKNPDLLMNMKMLRRTNLVWIISSHFSIWLATCLSIFYFLKISIFSNSLFLYLKWRVKRIILVALLLSFLPLLINILVTDIHIGICIDEFKTNKSYSYRLKTLGQLSRLLALTNTTFSFIPFTISLTTFFLLIFSLWKHMKRMQHITESSRDVSTTAHIKALQTVIAFLLLYAIFILFIAIQLWSYEFEKTGIFRYFFPVGIIAFPSVHSCFLIFGNNKLRQTSFVVLRWLRSKVQGQNPWVPDTFAG